VQALGGWTLSPVHAFDFRSGQVFEGDGTIRQAEGLGAQLVYSIGKDGGDGDYHEGEPAVGNLFDVPAAIRAAPNGDVYVSFYRSLWKIDRDGLFWRVAGQEWVDGDSGDYGPARDAYFDGIEGIAIGGDGSIYVADDNTCRIRRISPDGYVYPVAGSGVCASPVAGDAMISPMVPYRLDVTPDGSVVFVNWGDTRIWQVGTDGQLMPIAGRTDCTFTVCPEVDGQSALSGALGGPYELAVGPDGAVYIEDGDIYRLDPDGRIWKIAGNGTTVPGPSGSVALDQGVYASALAVGPDGTVYYGDSLTDTVRKIRKDGIVVDIVGDGDNTVRENVAGLRTGLDDPWDVDIAPDGAVYVADYWNGALRKAVTRYGQIADGELLVASASGSEVYAFDGRGRHLRTMDARTGATLAAMTYDSVGRIVQIRDADGRDTAIERAIDGTPTAIVSPDGLRTDLALDGDGWLATVTAPGNLATDLGYDPGGLLTSQVEPGGEAHAYAYTDGRLVSDTDGLGHDQSLAVAITADGREVTQRSAAGLSTIYAVSTDVDGSTRREVVHPDGTITSAVGAADGTSTVTHPDGTVVTTRFDADPRFALDAPFAGEVITTRPSGVTTTTTVTRQVTLSDPADPLSLASEIDTIVTGTRTSTIAWTPTGTVFTTPEGRTTRTTVDAAGRLLTVEPSGRPVEQYTWTSGRLTDVDAGARGVSMAYDADGRVATVVSATGGVDLGYDARGNVVTVTGDDGEVAAFDWDDDGQLVTITPPGRAPQQLTWDDAHRVVTITDPDVGSGTATTDYTWDDDGRPLRVDRPDGTAVVWTWDADRIDTITTSTGTVAYSYDGAGQVATISAPDADVAVTWDGSLPTSFTWSGAVTGTVAHTWTPEGLLESQTVAGSTVSWSYDDDGRVTAVGALSLALDPASGRIDGSTLGVVDQAIAWDAATGLPSGNTASVASIPVWDEQATLDAAGRATAIDRLGTANDAILAYDVRGRLASVSDGGGPVASWTWDANGNRLSQTDGSGTVTGSYDDRDRLLSWGALDFAWSEAGDLQTRTDTGTGDVTGFAYDERANLLEVDLPDGTVVTYAIDGLGRRVARSVDGVVTNRWLYMDGLHPVAEVDGTGNLVARFVQATVGTPAYLEKGGVTYALVTDRLGSVRRVVDAATGLVVQAIDYDAFGRVISDSNPGFQPFGFAGGLYDPLTGLVRFGARDYDPEVGRFTTPDRQGMRGGLNVYLYANGDPVNFVDPEGDLPFLAAFLVTPTGRALVSSVLSSVLDVVSQKIAHPDQKIDWNHVLTTAISGAITGALPTGGWFGLSPGYKDSLIKALTNGLLSSGSQIAANALNGCPLGNDAVVALISGGLSGGTGEVVKGVTRGGVADSISDYVANTLVTPVSTMVQSVLGY
jgi:RHS repeat-associated protein